MALELWNGSGMVRCFQSAEMCWDCWAASHSLTGRSFPISSRGAKCADHGCTSRPGSPENHRLNIPTAGVPESHQSPQLWLWTSKSLKFHGCHHIPSFFGFSHLLTHVSSHHNPVPAIARPEAAWVNHRTTWSSGKILADDLTRTSPGSPMVSKITRLTVHGPPKKWSSSGDVNVEIGCAKSAKCELRWIDPCHLSHLLSCYSNCGWRANHVTTASPWLGLALLIFPARSPPSQ